jgi:Ras-related GTP-binding protein A/B
MFDANLQVVLFERATFLVISHTVGSASHTRDPHRFEKISNIIKQFKLSCRSSLADYFYAGCVMVMGDLKRIWGWWLTHTHAPLPPKKTHTDADVTFDPRSKSAAHFQSMEVRNDKFAAFIDYFTTNTYVMVIMSDPTIRKCPLSLTMSHVHFASLLSLALLRFIVVYFLIPQRRL